VRARCLNLSQMARWRCRTSSAPRRHRCRGCSYPGVLRKGRNDRYFWVDLVRGTIYVLLPHRVVSRLSSWPGRPADLAGRPASRRAERRAAGIRVARCLAGDHQAAGHQRRRFFNRNGADPSRTRPADELPVHRAHPVHPGRAHLHVRQDGRRIRQGAAILGVMAIIFGAWLAIAAVSEHQANPAITAAGLTHQQPATWRAKRSLRRHSSALYATASTQTSTAVSTPPRIPTRPWAVRGAHRDDARRGQPCDSLSFFLKG